MTGKPYTLASVNHWASGNHGTYIRQGPGSRTQIHNLEQEILRLNRDLAISNQQLIQEQRTRAEANARDLARPEIHNDPPINPFLGIPEQGLSSPGSFSMLSQAGAQDSDDEKFGGVFGH